MKELSNTETELKTVFLLEKKLYLISFSETQFDQSSF